jgi:hypothetical protein
MLRATRMLGDTSKGQKWRTRRGMRESVSSPLVSRERSSIHNFCLERIRLTGH